MATKTKDYKVIITDQQDEYIFSAKNKNAIYIKSISQEDIDTDSFRIVGDNLLFTALKSSTRTSACIWRSRPISP